MSHIHLQWCLAKKVPLKDIKIYATDIDDQVLEKAKDGVYSANSLKGLPDEYKNKYFEKMGDKYYKISDEIKKCVEFKKSNLLKDSYPQSCHLIVCRNVLIYFTEDAKLEIYKKFNDSLVKGRLVYLLVIQSRLSIIKTLVMNLVSYFSTEKSNQYMYCLKNYFFRQFFFIV